MPPIGPTRKGRLARFAGWRLNWEPGTRFEYHPTAAHWVMAELIERGRRGTDYRTLIDGRVLDPLGLHRLGSACRGEQGDVARPVPVGEPPTPEELEAALGIADSTSARSPTDARRCHRPKNSPSACPAAAASSSAAELALYYQALLHNPGGLWDPSGWPMPPVASAARSPTR